MYYIRGALSAASNYYKDLPAINPSTLTGAIDVIVVQKPREDGGMELACTPFHVRFGKWQVLRPSDRMVTVQLNGKPIPFNMKIGDAGEAFWVFETDDDVPDELITSPVIEPTTPRQAPVKQQGAFGATEDSDDDGQLDPNLAIQDEIALARVEAARQANGASRTKEDEPEFLDLDAVPSDGKARPTELHHQLINPSDPNVDDDESPTAARFSAAEFLNHASDAGKGAVQTAKTHLTRPPKLNATTAAEALEMTGKDVRPPEVKHEHGVALDLAGYHAREMSDRTVKDYGRRVPSGSSKSLGNLGELEQEVERENFAAALEARRESLQVGISSSSSRATTPEIDRPSSLSIRATSEPPESGDQQRVPEYEWEWGAFPLKTPGITDGPQFLFPRSAVSDDEDFAGPTASALNSSADIEKKSRRGLVQLGQLKASETGNFLLDMDNKKFEFELSLCGDDAWATLSNEEARIRAFAERAVSYQKFLRDDSVVTSSRLVIRWNSKYIARADTSPLFAALVSWREVALGHRRTATVEDDPLSSGDEREPTSPTTTATALPTARTTSTWSRWWRGSSSRKQSTTAVPGTYGGPDRPGIKLATSEPTVHLSEPVTPPSISQSLPMSPAAAPRKRYVKTLRLTSDQLKELNLNDGLNTITFSLSVTGAVACTARIFLWGWTDLVVVSDIDGTITKSDALGHVMTFMGRDWTHSGVAKLYTDICRNGYRIMYLTSRAIGQAGSTRHYLKGINQDSYQLPEGPVIMSPDRLLTSLHREVIMRRPEVFKMACLQDIRSIFGGNNPFYAGFGNRITDAASYLKVDIPSARIFTIEYSGEVKMELLERAGFKSSYIHMTDLVDQMFPPVHRSVSPAFTDLNYWRAPIDDFPLPDLTPPSPALSARSGRSTLSRFNPASAISLLSSRSRSPASQDTSPERGNFTGLRTGHARAQSLPLHVEEVDATLEEVRKERQRRDEEYVAELHRKRRKSIDSMPGSLPSSSPFDADWAHDDDDAAAEALEEGGEDEDEDDEYDDEDDPEAEAEDAFDEDLLATGEMENVPFL